MVTSRREVVIQALTVGAGWSWWRSNARRDVALPTHQQADSALAGTIVLAALITGEYRLIVIDPAEDQVRQIPVSRNRVFRGAIRVGARGVIVAAAPSDSSETTVYGVDIAEGTTQILGSVADSAFLSGYQRSPDSLMFLRFDAHFQPIGITWLEPPTGWAPPPEIIDDTGDIVWIGRTAQETEAEQREPRVQIARVAGTGTDELVWQDTAILISPYHSFLLSSDSEQIFVVDWSAHDGADQTVTVVSATDGEVLDEVVFWHERYKRPPSAAVLSLDDSRLFVLANTGNAGDGIRVFDTARLGQVAHWVPGTQFHQLAMSRDGRQLLALDDAELAVIDASAGRAGPAIRLDGVNSLSVAMWFVT